MNRLSEKTTSEADTLSRVWTTLNDPGRTFAMLTAFLTDYSSEENLRRNQDLKADLREAGFGFWIVEGY